VSKVLDLTLPSVGSFKAVLGSLIVIKGFVEFVSLVEYEWTLGSDGLVERFACEQDEPRVVLQTFDQKFFIVMDFFIFEDTGSTLCDCFLVLDFKGSLVNDDHTVPEAWNDMLVLNSFVNCNIDEIRWSTSSDGAFYSKYFSCNNFGKNLVILEFWNLSSLEFLILWLAILVSSIKVQP
jgi:hypothetical protein